MKFSATILLLAASSAAGRKQCLPGTIDTTQNGSGYSFSREGYHTKCNDGTSDHIDNAQDAGQCAAGCAAKGDMSTSLKLHGFDYNCDKKTCDCIYGTKWETINDHVKSSNENMACYALDQDACFPGITDNGFRQKGDHTKCNDGNFSTVKKTVQDANQCDKECTAMGDASTSLLLYGFDFDCDAKTCDCLYGTKWETIDGKVTSTSENKACYGKDKNVEEEDVHFIMDN